jgi:glucose/arabinose dehydrogenase
MPRAASRTLQRSQLMTLTRYLIAMLAAAALAGPTAAQQSSVETPGIGPDPALPKPDLTASAENFSRIIGWPDGRVPTAPAGFTVTAFARKLDSPRWLYVLPNGDVLVAEARTLPKSEQPASMRQHMVTSGSVGVSQNRIVLLRDADRDGVAETRSVFLDNLNQPFGMTLVGDTLFVANTDGVMRFPYKEGDRRIEAPGDLILPLPAGGYNNHWTRNVVAKPDGRKLYISVGSASNVGEYGMDEEVRRANILEINLDGSGEKVFASGLRNPNGMAWQPATGALWTAVNERDGLGDDLVPDYITSVREDGFYGWPYSYFGKNEDPRLKGKRPELVARAIVAMLRRTRRTRQPPHGACAPNRSRCDRWRERSGSTCRRRSRSSSSRRPLAACRPPDQPLVCSSQNLRYRMAMPLPLDLRRKHRSTYPPDGGARSCCSGEAWVGSCDSEHHNSPSDKARNTASVSCGVKLRRAAPSSESFWSGARKPSPVRRS